MKVPDDGCSSMVITGAADGSLKFMQQVTELAVSAAPFYSLGLSLSHSPTAASNACSHLMLYTISSIRHSTILSCSIHFRCCNIIGRKLHFVCVCF